MASYIRSLKELVYKFEKEQHLHPSAAPDQLYPSTPLGPRPNHSLTFTHLASGTYKTCTSYLSPTDSSLYMGIWREREPNLKKQSKYSSKNTENGVSNLKVSQITEQGKTILNL